MILTPEATSAIIGAVVGGLIAMGGAWLLTWRKDSNDREALRKGLTTELLDVKDRLASVVYLLESHLGNLNRELLKWAQANTRGKRNLSPQGIEALDKILKMSDEQINFIAQRTKGKDDAALSLKTFDLAFLDAQLGKLGLLSMEEQDLVLQIRARIRVTNQEIEQSRFYSQSSFVPDSLKDNLLRLRENLLSSYRQISKDGKKTVALINKLTKMKSA